MHIVTQIFDAILLSIIEQKNKSQFQFRNVKISKKKMSKFLWPSLIKRQIRAFENIICFWQYLCLIYWIHPLNANLGHNLYTSWRRLHLLEFVCIYINLFLSALCSLSPHFFHLRQSANTIQTSNSKL